MRKIVFAVPPMVHLLDINGPAHIFYEAKEFGIDIKLYFVSIDGKTETESSAGLYFSKLLSFSQIDLNEGDLLFIPGLEYDLISNEEFIQSIAPFLEWVKLQYQRKAHICSICTGSYLLSETGLLNHRIATTHWKYFDDFARKFPKVKLEKERLFTSSENLHTSAGVASGIDLSLYLLEQFYGTKLALDVAKEVVIYFRRSTSDPQLSIFLQYRNHLDQRIHLAQDYLLNNLPETPSIEILAEKVCMSKRNLTRLFKKTLGITIGAYVEKLRVEKAVSLLSKGHKVDFVANQLGLSSANQLRNILRKHRGVLPTEIASLNK
ncbi:GlxA family transcriptional regulator [Flavobacteriaceae bacterium M23B6Z8]